MNKTKKVITKTSLVVFGAFCLTYTFCSSDFSSATNASLSMSATIEPSMTIVFNDNELDINITPSSSGTFGQAETTIWSLCNNPSGCSLYMESDQQLTNGDDIINTLDNRSGGYTMADFPSNRWGVSTDGSNYFPVAAMGKLLDIERNNDVTYGEDEDGVQKDFSFGVKLDLSAAMGQYSTTLNFIAVAAPYMTPIDSLTYMQDFAKLTSFQKADVIASMTQNQQYTLRDSRDNKEYYIAKLADGNVWMTQNLDHNIGEINVGESNEGVYTSDDTDIPDDYSWAPSSNTTEVITSWTDTETAPQSHDPGDVCWDGIVHNSGGTLADNTKPCSDASANVHYSIGNYYNWTAAVAMNDSSSYTTQNTDVNQSICPAGWMLPKGGGYYTGSGSFRYLVDQLGLTAGIRSNTKNAPVFFVNGGSLYTPVTDRYGGVGTYYGYYWSSVVSSNSASYNLSFQSSTLSYQSALRRYYGFSVRCVVR